MTGCLINIFLADFENFLNQKFSHKGTKINIFHLKISVMITSLFSRERDGGKQRN